MSATRAIRWALRLVAIALLGLGLLGAWNVAGGIVNGNPDAALFGAGAAIVGTALCLTALYADRQLGA